MAEKEWTVTQSVKEVLDQMKPNTCMLGYQLHNQILANLGLHGSTKRPMDSTTMRCVRQYGEQYGVKAVSIGNSKYCKTVKADK